MDSNLTELYEETLGLSRVLGAIAKSWKQIPFIAVAQADPDGNLWSAVKTTLDDCKSTLEKLDNKINDVQREGVFGRGLMRKATKQIKLNMRMKDIVLFKQQIHWYNSGMQSALQMINV